MSYEINYVSDYDSNDSDDDSYIFVASPEMECEMALTLIVARMRNRFQSVGQTVKMVYDFIEKCAKIPDQTLLAEFLKHVRKNKAYHTAKIIDYVRGVCTRGTYCIEQLHMFANTKNKYSQNLRFMVETCADYFTNDLDQLERAIITIQHKFDRDKKTKLKLETYLNILYNLFQGTNRKQFIEFTKRRVGDLNTIKNHHTHHEIWRQARRVRTDLFGDSDFWIKRLLPSAQETTCTCELCKSWKRYSPRPPEGPPPPGSRGRH
jgi:hypothetical protein